MPTNRSVGVVALRSRGVSPIRRTPQPGRCDLVGLVTVRGRLRKTGGGSYSPTASKVRGVTNTPYGGLLNRLFKTLKNHTRGFRLFRRMGVTNPFREVTMTDLNALEALYFAALEKPPAERPAFLDAACAGDQDLRARVERLLAAQPKLGGFLDPPAATTDLPAAGPTDTFTPGSPRSGEVATAGFHDSEAPPPSPPDGATATLGTGPADPAPSPTADYPGRDEKAGTVIAGKNTLAGVIGEGGIGSVWRAEQTDPVIGGKYTLVEVIGEGGMGFVWRAKQTDPVKRFVAVKLIKPGMDSKAVLARFDAERQALAVMDHPHIAKVLDGGVHDGHPYFVMELVKGVPITTYCDQHRLTPQARLELFVGVCQAIQHAHTKGVIHRDIKPSNVLVALYDDKPVVKVIDFGVAKATGGTLTERTIDTGFVGVVGTPQYMSPEQATFNNLDIDTRADVYALGVCSTSCWPGRPRSPGGSWRRRDCWRSSGWSGGGPAPALDQALNGRRAADPVGQPRDRAAEADPIVADRAGLGGDEGSGEGSVSPVRDGQRVRGRRPPLPGRRAGVGPPPEHDLSGEEVRPPEPPPGGRGQPGPPGPDRRGGRDLGRAPPG